MDDEIHSTPMKTKNFDENGFVLLTALMVIFLIVSIVSVVALVTASDMRSAAIARASIETRVMSESVADAVFASIATEKSNLYQKAVNNFRTNPGVTVVDEDTNPLKAPTLSEYGDWFALNDDGTLVRCINDVVSGTCFRAKLTQDTAPVAKSQQITLDVVARGACIVDDPDNPRNCIYRKFQQTFRTRAYLENVSLTEDERPLVTIPELSTAPAPTATPGNPYKVAYIESDILQGEIRTNDDRFLRCGTIDESLNPKFSSSDPLTEELPSQSGDCVGSEFSTLIADAFDKFLPRQFDRSGISSDTQSESVFSALAGGSTSSSPYYLTLGGWIQLGLGSITINGANLPYPSNGVIFSAGALTIRDSQYSQSLSIVSKEDITIEGNVVLVKPGTPTPLVIDGIGSNIPGETDAMIGITSSKNIRLDCNASSTVVTVECDPRSIVGILSTPSGTIFNTTWNSSLVTDINNPRRFNLFGAMIAQNRPVLGAYNSVSDAKVTTGWAKTLRFDTRLRETQPPYFFRTTQASVVRSSLEVSRCTETFCS